MEGRVVAIIQARMGSTRFPGKIMKNLFGKSVLAHVIERVKQIKSIDDVVIATTMLVGDDIVEQEAAIQEAKVFRGSEEDVLSRYYYAAQKYKAQSVVRITSDCPLIDPVVCDEIIGCFQQNVYDLVTNAGGDLTQRTYPRGLDTEVFSFQLLEEVFKKADVKYQREHVTPYIYEHSDRIFYYKNQVDYSRYRWTLDTAEDFALIREIYRHLYKGKHDFYLTEVIKLIEKYPELAKLNENIKQKNITS
ncbi:MAG: 3-deoxy-manno-octulosonate cytidylyltransferase [Pelotomaculum sp. PtaB.Bin013]|nr:MAG: 3-deoxy-manno-octulosonate cytidylyltransferase [Pelotomaculum sp. PtaB.Bin013]